MSLNADTGSLYDICNQNLNQTRCYGPGRRTSGLSFIHAYPGGGTATCSSPIVRDVSLAGGCGTPPSNPDSNPYFNVDDGTDLPA